MTDDPLPTPGRDAAPVRRFRVPPPPSGASSEGARRVPVAHPPGPPAGNGSAGAAEIPLAPKLSLPALRSLVDLPKINTAAALAGDAPPPPPVAEPAPTEVNVDAVWQEQAGKDVVNPSHLTHFKGKPGPVPGGSGGSPSFVASLYEAQDVATLKGWVPPPDAPRTPKEVREAYVATPEEEAITLAKIQNRDREELRQALEAQARVRRAEEEERAWVEERRKQLLRKAKELLSRPDSPWAQVFMDLGEAMREIAALCIAQSICPNHVEYVPELRRYVAWDGVLSTDQDLLRNGYTTGGHRDDTDMPEFFSPREVERGMHQPRAGLMLKNLTPREVVLRVPFKGSASVAGNVVHDTYQFVAPSQIRMVDRRVTVYVIDKWVYTHGQLEAAAHAYRTLTLGRKVTWAANAIIPDTVRKSVAETVSETVGKTTRFFRRKPGPG